MKSCYSEYDDKYKFEKESIPLENLRHLTQSLETLHAPLSSLMFTNHIPTLKQLNIIHCVEGKESLKLDKRLKSALYPKDKQQQQQNCQSQQQLQNIKHLSLHFDYYSEFKISKSSIKKWIENIFLSDALGGVPSIEVSDRYFGVILNFPEYFFGALKKRKQQLLHLSITHPNLLQDNRFFDELLRYLSAMTTKDGNCCCLTSFKYNKELLTDSIVQYLLTECPIPQVDVIIPAKMIMYPLQRRFDKLTLSLSLYRFQIPYEPPLNIDNSDIFQSLNQVNRLYVVIDRYGYEYNSKINTILASLFESNTQSSLINTELFLDEAPLYDHLFDRLLKAIESNHHLKQVELLIKSVSIPMHHSLPKLSRLISCINNHPTITNKSQSIKIIPGNY
ncbi:hypothetical protein PPL_11781 [Heterostelium album PN500]|uniref:Uncharacterized protein n=1 Tax=Heterostelium pallidum (strain ATCC 26659 / Pp 5 / PN500) TaxID=670386 RepID=D3BUG1_HETP5|nr:hypothetical protein PPL_11781 [Heterostelium album PN500]EFA74749.1 hypothetical protein PPL_11781 [Heterostelium album PN500]|eukprot:XP_020426883.1 hypothetical protein PPL_11781 [Heterostelium album PN500]